MKKKIGQVLSAKWDDAAGCVRLELALEGSKLRVQGMLRPGRDSVSGNYLGVAELRAAVPRLARLTLYDHTGRLDPARLTAEGLRRLRISLSLDDLAIGLSVPETNEPDANTFLRSIFR